MLSHVGLYCRHVGILVKNPHLHACGLTTPYFYGRGLS
jgi:hypothetical protein